MKPVHNSPNSASSIEAPLCTAFDPNPRHPQIKLPPLSCDTQAHICGPPDLYPYYAERIYTPPDSLVADYQHQLSTVGVDRAVLVQPTVYGTDDSAMLDAITTAGPQFCGVAVVTDDIAEDDLARCRSISWNASPCGSHHLAGIWSC